MAEKISMPVPAAVGQYLSPTATSRQKLLVIENPDSLSFSDQITLLFCLARDRDAAVRERASTAFASLPAELLVSALHESSPHPVILDVLARMHCHNPPVVTALLRCAALSSPARLFLEGLAASEAPQAESPTVEEATPDEAGEAEPDDWCQEPEIDDDCAEGFAETEEEYLSKYQLAQMMGIAEKIKMALTGDKEWRAILVRDANKLVSGSVIKNPRITEAEVLTILKAGVQNDEIIRLICSNKEWIKNYQIRKALVENPKTPLPNALRYLATLGEKDVASYAKSKNISSVISTQAKRMLLAKKR